MRSFLTQLLVDRKIKDGFVKIISTLAPAWISVSIFRTIPHVAMTNSGRRLDTFKRRLAFCCTQASKSESKSEGLPRNQNDAILSAML